MIGRNGGWLLIILLLGWLTSPAAAAEAIDKGEDHHLLFILTNADKKEDLRRKFDICIASLFATLPAPSAQRRLNIHMVTDEGSEAYVRQKIAVLTRPDVRFEFTDHQTLLPQVAPQVKKLQQHFSAKGSYYDNSIFYLSTVMHKLMPPTIKRMVQLDVDIMLEHSVYDLFAEFDRFDDDDLMALAPEMQPVYYHNLHTFRQQNPLKKVGYPLPEGHPGFNSGAILLNLERMRKSKIYNEMLDPEGVQYLVDKYSFRGHLGDQDFFSLLNFEHAELFYQLSCGWNHQYCQWWVEKGGYAGSEIGTRIRRCSEPVKLHHGNCSSHIPGSQQYVHVGDTSGTAAASEPAPVKTVTPAKAVTPVETSVPAKDTDHSGMHAAAGWDKHKAEEVIHLSLVACGDRLPESLIALKSAQVLTRSPLHLHLLADAPARAGFFQQLRNWPAYQAGKMAFSLYPISYPGVDEAAWKELFKLCASQRLFLPYLLKGTQRVIYIDTDVLFLRNPKELWMQFDAFNAEQLAALTPEHNSDSISWYKNHARHPYVPPHGVNSGVMLMDLARMRAAGWREHLVRRHSEFNRGQIPWGDQDLINIYFHDRPQQLHTYSCNWNYRPDFCLYMSDCEPADKDGVYVLHGNRRAFQPESAGKYAAFKAVYEAFKQYPFGQPLRTHLLTPMKLRLKLAQQQPRDHCDRGVERFTAQLEKSIDRLGSATANDEYQPGLYDDVAVAQLQPWAAQGITKQQLQRLEEHQRDPVKYQVIDGRLYRQQSCLFPARCSGIEHFLHQFRDQMPDMEFYINVRDYPLSWASDPLPVFSFSKILGQHADIMYPAWAFWEGGPAVSVIKTWRWDKNRREMLDSGKATPWPQKKTNIFFRGSRTNAVRDSLVLHALEHPEQWNVHYTLNQSQRSTRYVTETLKLTPAGPVPLRDHCQHRYLLNFDGVAASFRLRNILACGSLVLYVNPQWKEFFYSKLKPWVHYVPIPSDAEHAQPVIDMLRENDGLAQQVADNGRDFIARDLTMRHVNEYWLKLMLEYASLQRFQPQLDPQLMEIK